MIISKLSAFLSGTYEKKKKKKNNENQVFAILKILGSFRYNNVKFFNFFIQTTFLRFETTYIMKKFSKKFEFLNFLGVRSP